MEITTIGLDIAKRVFQALGADATGKAVLRRKLQRAEVLAFFASLPPCLVGIEACSTAHHWAREIRALGHKVRLMPASYVKPYVKRGKTDSADAEAICEAVTRPSYALRADQDRGAASGADAAPDTRPAGSATDHAGECAARAHGRAGHHRPARHRPRGRSRRERFWARMKPSCRSLPDTRSAAWLRSWRHLGERVKEIEGAILAWHKDNEASRRLATIPGIGPITASAIVATVTDPTQFHSARQFAAWIGLVPKQNSSGGKERQGGISKQGDRYLRRLLVLGGAAKGSACLGTWNGCGGATAVIRHARTKVTAETAWLRGVLDRRPVRLASVAQANKTARIVWALLARGESYRAPAA